MAKLRLHISTQPNKTSEVAEICWRNQPQLLIALRTRSAWKPSNRNSIIYCFRRSTDNCELQFSHAPPVCALLYIYAIGKLLRPRASHFSGCALFQFPAGGTRPCGPRVAPRNRDVICNMIHIHSPQSPRKSRLSDI
jgi:hypothetical protein